MHKPCDKFSLRAATLIVVVLCALCSLSLPPRQAAHGATASYKKRLRVMSYNIHVGIGIDKKLDLARIAEVITRERPDLVGLQEVDRGVERTQRLDEIAELARLTKMEYAFAHNLDFQGGQYGVAILSRHPILALDHRRFQHLREAERRGFIRSEINVGGKRIHFVTTHLDYQHADNRLYETQQLLRALGDLAGPVIVAGDFNDEPSGSSYKLMLAPFVDAWSGEEKESLTFPADKPVKRIDYIFIKRAAGMTAKGARVVATQASDHLPLVVDLEID